MTETVLITGSSRGIGKAIAVRLSAAGYPIVLHCRSRIEDAEAVQEEIITAGGSARILQFDVADRE
ncbi:MAG: SDR family NAD(P)-dependent oxidoreductase, partial [Pseudomonadales bacterium]